jgi:hypothetical protein
VITISLWFNVLSGQSLSSDWIGNDEDAVTGLQDQEREGQGNNSIHLNKKRILPPFLRNLLPNRVFLRKLEN